MSVRITVLLEEGVDAQFTSFCQEKGFKKSTLAARLIREHLAQEAESRLVDLSGGAYEGASNKQRRS